MCATGGETNCFPLNAGPEPRTLTQRHGRKEEGTGRSVYERMRRTRAPNTLFPRERAEGADRSDRSRRKVLRVRLCGVLCACTDSACTGLCESEGERDVRKKEKRTIEVKTCVTSVLQAHRHERVRGCLHGLLVAVVEDGVRLAGPQGDPAAPTEDRELGSRGAVVVRRRVTGLPCEQESDEGLPCEHGAVWLRDH